MNAPSGPPPAADRGFFGHPKGLEVLFFTELWERFGYYGMRALLVLYLTASVAEGGLGYDADTGGAIYALYTALVYLMALPGGWIADRVIGQRRAVLIGGILIAAGYYALAVPSVAVFYGGLFLVTLGTGLLKPNISAIVGQLYARDDDRRDAGFSIFYMGINFGAFGGPLLCSWLGEQVDWKLGFSAAGVGMTVGLAVYLARARILGEAGMHPATPRTPEARAEVRRQLTLGTIAAAAVGAAAVAAAAAGWIETTPSGISDAFGAFLLALIVVFFGWLFLGNRWTPVERGRLAAIVALFLAAAFFWGGYEQAGSTLTLFANKKTDRFLDLFAWEFPAGWFQWVPALFVIVQAPLFAWLWVRLGRRQPSSPAKFALGLTFLGLGYVVMVAAAGAAGAGGKVGIGWLLATYFLHVVGEMCLSPVGLSTITKLAPERVTGLMMGVWFLAASAGSFLAGTTARFYERMDLATLFGTVAATCIGGGVVLALLIRPIRRLMGGIH